MSYTFKLVSNNDKCNLCVATIPCLHSVKVVNKNKTAKSSRKKAINLIISQKNAKFASLYHFIYLYRIVWLNEKTFISL